MVLPHRRAALALGLLVPLLAGCTAQADGDGDGLDEAAEGTVYEIRVQTQNGTVVRQITSDPRLADTDGDGLDDGEEADARTDPRDVDTDGDGLVDGPDLRPTLGSALYALLVTRNLVRAVDDGRFLGELTAGTRPFDWDGDRPFPDGLGDGEELRGWNVTVAGRTYHVQSDPQVPDTDRDGLNDLEERLRACDPRNADTDGDGVPDALDADCTRNLRLVVAVASLQLERSLDPTGDTELLVEAQVAGLEERQQYAVRTGRNNLTFRWVVDLPDQGPHHRLVVPVVLAFWDLDPAGDDAESGVQRQPVCFVAATAPCNVLVLQLDLFAGRYTTDRGPGGTTEGEASGPDGSVRFSLQPLPE